ncbi:outer membrane beta-barrel protein [Photobacterium sp. OFAV2-7]|uniref:outer membrane beta-barrel protein n=1 Tax=Photobacterium sp. OFAV2-7 TaxID=2917748 RepID=UPI001EF5FBA9|nr:outer membrane beta-barrel protein [Photobacterium sp. OFAV2-7]MCG7588175.1 outer membrane beta-barrel protein [Photobacterium sp. OFAV2-7]
MKKTIISLGIISALFPAFANAGNAYIGASVGQASYDNLATSDIEDSASSLGMSIIDDSDTGFKVFGGYRANEHFAVELFYANLGEVSVNLGAASSLFGTNELTIEQDTLGASLIGILPVTDNFELFGKVGFHAWDATINLTSDVKVEAADGTDPMFGAGIAYKYNRVSIQAEFERYQLDETDIDLMSIGLAYHF